MPDWCSYIMWSSLVAIDMTNIQSRSSLKNYLSISIVIHTIATFSSLLWLFVCTCMIPKTCTLTLLVCVCRSYWNQSMLQCLPILSLWDIPSCIQFTLGKSHCWLHACYNPNTSVLIHYCLVPCSIYNYTYIYTHNVIPNTDE